MPNAPAVYVPTEPEGNGLALPTLLSLLAHGIIIGILIYNYQSTEIETTGSIETVMVSPEQLAEMQGQILANRAAASAMQTDSSTSESSTSALSEMTSSDTSAQSSSQPSSERVPVFTRSDEPASQPMLMSQEHHQRLRAQNQEYERRMAEWAAEIDESAIQELDQVEQDKREQLIEEQKQLRDFRQKQNNPPKIRRPTATDRNIEIDTGSAGNAGRTFSLSDGQSTISGDTSISSPSTGSSRSASGGSRGASNSEIINLIRRNYTPPTAAKGSTQRATLTITVNANGNVVNVTASGPDSVVNEAARQAVLSTGSLPIDTDDPKYPTFTIQFRGSN